MTLYEVAEELGRRLASTFTRDEDGTASRLRRRRAVPGRPDWGDNLLFYEYFHGDNGAGIGASHQTGWTGVVATSSSSSPATTPKACCTGPSRPG